jgi:putative ABC transport system permease protein
VSSTTFLGNLIDDARYAGRRLLKDLAFAFVSILTLGLGIGGVTAIFSVVNGVLLRPLPYREPGRLVKVLLTNPSIPELTLTPRDFAEISRQTGVFDDLAMYSYARMNLTGAGEPLKANVTLGTAGIFDTLGVNLLLGRPFRADEDRSGEDHVAVISERFWRSRFNSGQDVLGKSIYLKDQAYSIIGVLPSDFGSPDEIASPKSMHSEVWIPGHLEAEGTHPNGISQGWVVARLRAGATIQGVQAELHVIAVRSAQELREENFQVGGWDYRVAGLKGNLVGKSISPLLLLLGAAGFVFLIACVNIANLTLARAAGRQKEIAIRESLGASRPRVVQQLVTEGLLLSLLGGLVGLFGAWGGVRTLIAVAPGDTPRLTDVHVDLMVAAFAFAMSLIAAILFGLLPAAHISKADLNAQLKEGRQQLQIRLGKVGTRRLRSFLVFAQTALAMVLLAAAGLLARTFWKLTRADRGFDTHNLLVIKVDHSLKGANLGDKGVQYLKSAIDRIRMLPGVQYASAVSVPPLASQQSSFQSIQEEPGLLQGQPVLFRAVSPGYFQTVGQRVLIGRDFTDFDSAEAPGVVAVNESFARRYLPSLNSVGKHVITTWDKKTWEIVAVVSDADDAAGTIQDFTVDRKPEIYFSFRQEPASILLVRTRGDPLKMAASIRGQIPGSDDEHPILSFSTVEQSIWDLTAPPRFRFTLLAAFAGVALLLALVGVYGVASYDMAERAHEFAVRMALGARPDDLLKLVFRQGLIPVMGGILTGLAGAATLTRLLARFLFGIPGMDLPTFLFASALFFITTLAAIYIPARHATVMDPMVTLRNE